MSGTLDFAGGGPLSALSIFIIVAVLQIFEGLIEYIKKGELRHSQQPQLREEIKQLLKEANSLSTPSTFAQAAKLRRLAAAKEKELVRKQEEHGKNRSHDLYARVLLVCKVFLYAGLILWFWGAPVARVPPHILQPFGKFLSWGSSRDSVTAQIRVGMIPWLVLTSRVSKFLCQKLLMKCLNT